MIHETIFSPQTFRYFMKHFFLAASLCGFTALAQEPECINPDHSSHNHTSLLNYAPAGVMGTHAHNQGEWMVGFKSMYMHMNELQDGTSSVKPSEVLGMPIMMGKPTGKYMAVPTDMRMEMHMLDIMYGLSDKLTLAIMLPWIKNSMSVQMMNGTKFKTRSEGLGDIKLGGHYKIFESHHQQALVGLTLSLPTGSIDEEANTPMSQNMRLGYPMQLGSGTVDFIPSFAYTETYDQWSWGSKLETTLYAYDNDEDYRKGNSAALNLWANRLITTNWALSSRLKASAWSDYKGEDEKLAPMAIMNPVADSNLRAGERLDIFIGSTWNIFSDHRLQVEVGTPIHQDIDGPNLAIDYQVNFSWSYAF